MKGKVYLFKMKNTTFYKIGMTESESVDSRFMQFKTYAPSGGEIICVFNTENARVLEKRLHQKFKDKRLSGEFFNLSENDVENLKTEASSDETELKDFFWKNVIGRDLTISQLTKAFNAIKIEVRRPYCINKVSIIEYNENNIISYIESNLKGGIMTNTQIRDKLITEKIIDDSFSKKLLGTLLKKNYHQYMKNIQGVVLRIYELN